MYTVPFHWEAMSSNVLPLSEYCNAMSNFYQSDLLSLWHVVTYCLESCVKWEHASWLTFLFFHEECNFLRGLRWWRRDRGVARDRDWPFILKGLFTMVISAWGTGYNTRYQGIKARSVQRVFVLFGLNELHYVVVVGGFFLCVRNMSKWKSRGTLSMPLLKKRSWLCVGFHHCALFVAERNLQVHFVSEMLFQDPSFLPVGVCTISILVCVGTCSLPTPHQSETEAAWIYKVA